MIHDLSNPLGLDTNTLNALFFCERSYDDTDSRTPAFDSYTYDRELSSKYIAVYVKDNRKVIYIAFRGTDFLNREDLEADKDIANGAMVNIPNKGINTGSKFYKRVLDGINVTLDIIDKYPDINNIKYTGHSLGGSITFILTRFVYGENADKTNIPWTNNLNTKSWAYDNDTFDKLNTVPPEAGRNIFDIHKKYKEIIFDIDFEGITFNPGVWSGANPYNSSECVYTQSDTGEKIRPEWCNILYNHVIKGDKISNSILIGANSTENPINYIKLYDLSGISMINKHKLESFRNKNAIRMNPVEYNLNPVASAFAKLGGKKHKMTKIRKMTKKRKKAKIRKMTKKRKKTKKIKLSKKRRIYKND